MIDRDSCLGGHGGMGDGWPSLLTDKNRRSPKCNDVNEAVNFRGQLRSIS